MSYCEVSKGLEGKYRFILVAENDDEVKVMEELKGVIGMTQESGDRIVIEREIIGMYDSELHKLAAFLMGLIHCGPRLIGEYQFGMRGMSMEKFSRQKMLQSLAEFIIGLERRDRLARSSGALDLMILKSGGLVRT